MAWFQLIPARADKAHERKCPFTFSAPPQVNETPAGMFGCLGPACMWWTELRHVDQGKLVPLEPAEGVCAAARRS